MSTKLFINASAVYLIKAGVDPLCVSSTNYYSKYLKLSKMVQNVTKAAYMYTNPYWKENHRVGVV